MGVEDLISRDFDFQIGSWNVRHRRLKDRLVGCTEWEDFVGTSHMRPILGGNGNVEDNVLHMDGGTYRAAAVRSFTPSTGNWAIWWLDARNPHTLGVPVIGKFVDGVGSFYCDDVHGGAQVRVRFLWLRTDTAHPQWEQAMSTDGGKSWETNWTMSFERA